MTESLPNIPLSIIVGGMGAIQVAKIAAESPPSFHTGGLLAPDEVNITGLRSELSGILTAQGTQAAGGETGVAALNRGETAPSTIIVEQRYQHRAFGAFVEDNVRMTSPLRTAIRTTRRGPVGHSTRR